MFFTLSEIRYRPLIKQSLSFVSLPQHRSEKIWKAFRSPFSDKVKRYSWISLGDVYVYMIYMAKDCGFVAKQKLSGYFVFSSSLAKIQGPARNIGLNWMYDLTNILTSNRWCALSSFLVDDFFRDSCIVNAWFCNFYKKYD